MTKWELYIEKNVDKADKNAEKLILTFTNTYNFKKFVSMLFSIEMSMIDVIDTTKTWELTKHYQDNDKLVKFELYAQNTSEEN